MNEPCFSDVNTQIFGKVELNRDNGKLGVGQADRKRGEGEK